MAKRNTSKAPKTYRVRVVNPSRPGAPRFMGEENPAVRKVEAFSKHRYRASPQEKARYGGSTITQFYVRYADPPHETKEIMGYGKTPGERKTDAIRKFRQHESTAANPPTDDPHELVEQVFADYYAGEIGREEIRSVAMSRARRWGADEGAVLDEIAAMRASGFPSRNPNPGARQQPVPRRATPRRANPAQTHASTASARALAMARQIS